MSDERRKAIAPEPGPRPCSLKQACVEAGLDQDGRRCPYCPLRGWCQSELRWLVKTAPEHVSHC